jgi:hypothetical protein
MLVAWYKERSRRAQVGTLFATLHFVAILALVVLISLWPSNDWPWWGLVPTVIDFPVSLPLLFLSQYLVDTLSRMPHAALEHFLLSMPEPFSSLDLFWLPAFSSLVLGTLWYYVWPQWMVGCVELIQRRRDRKRA